MNAGRTASAQTFAEGTGWQRRILVGDEVNFTSERGSRRGPASALATGAKLLHILRASLLARAPCTVHSHDAQGNPQNQPNDTFLVTLTPRARGNHAQQLRPEYLGGGRTRVRYTAAQPGSYVLSVTLKGYHVR